MEEILEGLNAEQRVAVEHDTGPLLVVAGAGTGKTRVITRRIAYLIRSGRAKPGEILALTFTEKAAREMEDRLYELIGWESFQVAVMTFNAFGAELLARYASHAGRSVRGGLLNETQKALLLQQHVGRIKLEYYGPQSDPFEFVSGIVMYIGQLQNAGVGAGKYEDYVAQIEREPGDLHSLAVKEQADLARLYRLYETLKTETGTFDYYDQLHVPVSILLERPNLADELRRTFRYVLVDEYQDTNPVQDELLRAFLPPGGNLFAVGDDDQAIYGFRGADIYNILNFSQHYEVGEALALVRNYRSGQPILDAAYKMIVNNNPERLEPRLGLDKRLIGESEIGDVEFVPYRTNRDEHESVADSIVAALTADEAASEITVLAAQHAPLAALARVLRMRNVPFALSTRTNIFDQPELLGLWHLLRWLAFEIDESAIGHVIMGPVLAWQPADFRRLLELSQEQLVTIEAALAIDGHEASRMLMVSLDEWRAWARDMPVSQLIYKLVFETGLSERWRQQGEASGRILKVFQDLNSWLEQVADYEVVALNTTLIEYVRSFPKPPVLEVTEPVGDAGGVQLLTVHASKGLEFDRVYLIGCTQRGWSPGSGAERRVPEALSKALDLPPEHEYRRLMYVAVTRARRFLTVSAATATVGGARQAVSRLVGELVGENTVRDVALDDATSDNGLVRALRDLQRFYPLRDSGERPASLPFEGSDGRLELSVTSLAAYDFCPFEFYLEHVLRIKQPVGPQIEFGNVLHKIFERYYKARLVGARLDLAELERGIDELWSDRGYEGREVAEADRQLASRTLAAFFAREEKSDRKLVGSEVPIVFEIPEAKLRLRGKIDALFEAQDGMELRDFKTSRTKTDPEKLAQNAKGNFQLRSYALAYELLNGRPPAQVVLDYVVTGVEGTAVLSQTILRNHRAKLVAMADKIRARDFAPNPSAKHVCAAIRYYGTGERDELIERALEESAGITK